MIKSTNHNIREISSLREIILFSSLDSLSLVKIAVLDKQCPSLILQLSFPIVIETDDFCLRIGEHSKDTRQQFGYRCLILS